MHESIRIGRVAGVAIGVNWSVLVIVTLLTWGLAEQTLPELYPGHSSVAYWLVSGIAAVAFFASLLAHELGHSIVARRHGVQVEAITLWLLGGVSKFHGEASSARDELYIAAVGPVVSLALSVGIGLVTGMLAVAGAPELVVAGGSWLATMNLLLAVFNLLPAFPLDGGRILRAWLWRSSNDQLRATRTASAVGRAFGFGFVALGILAAMSGGGIGGVWIVIIGLFVVVASTAEAAQIEQSLLLSDVRVAEIMTGQPVTAPGRISIRELIDNFVLGAHVSSFPIVDETGLPVALITLDRVRAIPLERRDDTTVQEAATPIRDLVVVGPDEKVNELLPQLAMSPAGRALVVENDRLVGIVSHTDVVRALRVRQLAPTAHLGAREGPPTLHNAT